jgi:hypothetical protein
VWGGLDTVQLKSDEANTNVTVPVFGLGVVRPSF